MPRGLFSPHQNKPHFINVASPQALYMATDEV